MLEDSLRLAVEIDTETHMVSIWKTDEGSEHALVLDEMEATALAEVLTQQLRELQ